MPIAKVHDHKTISSVEEDFIFEGFRNIWTWRPSWSYDLDNLYKPSSRFKRRLHVKFALIAKAVLETMFEKNKNIYI